MAEGKREFFNFEILTLNYLYMCLAIPGKILKINDQTAEVDFNGIRKEINISVVDVEVGDFVMVHAGFAIEKMDLNLVQDIHGYLGQK